MPMTKNSVLIIGREDLHSLYQDALGRDATVVCRSSDDVPASISEVMPDIIIIDCDYDVAKGIELLQLIKKGHPGIPVVFIAGRSSEEVIIQAYRVGAWAFFKVPPNLIELKCTMRGPPRVRQEDTENVVIGQDDKNNNSVDAVGNSVPPCLVRTISYILDNVAEQHSLDDLAEKANMSKFHFCRSFTRYCGVSPMRFITGLRINKAIELLKRGDLTISMLAFKVGYSDPASFNRQFKKLTGQTPTEYKLMIRRNHDQLTKL